MHRLSRSCCSILAKAVCSLSGILLLTACQTDEILQTNEDPKRYFTIIAGAEFEAVTRKTLPETIRSNCLYLYESRYGRLLGWPTGKTVY